MIRIYRWWMGCDTRVHVQSRHFETKELLDLSRIAIGFCADAGVWLDFNNVVPYAIDCTLLLYT